jgi:hypothetical protein
MILFWSLARGACQYLQPTGVIYSDNGIYQFLFHFGPPLPGILTRPHVMLRPLEDPAIPSEAVDDTPAPGWLCARRSRAGSHLSAQALGILRCRDVTGQPCIQVIHLIIIIIADCIDYNISFSCYFSRWRLVISMIIRMSYDNPLSMYIPAPAGIPFFLLFFVAHSLWVFNLGRVAHRQSVTTTQTALQNEGI